MKTPLLRITQGSVLADCVTESLREAILSNCFDAGEKLDQDLIAAQLGVSRTPVREALKRLAFEGFVEIRPRHGAFIAEVSRQDVREIYEIRQLLEAEVVRQVTSVIPESVLNELDSSLAEAEVPARSGAGDATVHFESDVHLHGTLLDFVENRLLKEMLNGLTNRISVVRRFAQSKSGPHLIESFEEHRDIIRAMRKRDPEQAAELMRLHLEKSGVRIQELVQGDLSTD